MATFTLSVSPISVLDFYTYTFMLFSEQKDEGVCATHLPEKVKETLHRHQY
ncbi:hypothetical protein [Peribacillus sp. NPDC096540]|uniref:hypothetical protein n=1 Tax=Peribacillus sp. NPDC096540 TaxID=3390612 RepID=UPI003CFD64FB